MKKYINGIILVSCIMFTTISCHTNSDLKDTSTFENDSIVVHNQSSDVKVIYPITGYDVLDDSVYKKVSEKVDAFIEFSNQISDTTNRPYQLYMTSKLVTSYKRYISVVVDVYEFSGGAHGNTYFYSYLYDANVNKIKLFSDILPKGSFGEFRSIIRNKLKKQLQYDEYINDGTELPENFSNFWITDSSAIFIFQPYDVAPYAEGILKVEVLNRDFDFKMDAE